MATDTKKKSSSSSRSKSRGSKFAGALDLLHRDHQEVQKLFKQFEKAGETQKQDLCRQICQELTIHSAVEEGSFYPECRQLGGEIAAIVLEGLEEHREVKAMIKELQSTATGDERFEPRMTLLQEDTEHHVQEEESQLFPKLLKEMGRQRLEELRPVLEQAKERLMGQGHAPGERRFTEEVQAEGARQRS